MKTLAIRQPWATYVAEGTKPIEVRTWRTAYRGPLLIVASGRPVDHADETGTICRLPTQIQLCIVDLVDVRPMVPDDIAPACLDWQPGDEAGCYAWVLAAPRHVTPVPHRGRLNLYATPDADIHPLPADAHYLDYISA